MHLRPLCGLMATLAKGEPIQPEAPTIISTGPTPSPSKHVNPMVARWLEDSTGAFNDAYALTELIQWVWRSRVRRAEPIILFLPSPRMQGLFEEWLAD
jgi:hypothetical protein